MTTFIKRYTIENFNEIMFKGFSYNLSPETLEIIQSISDKVGSPEYIKTPQFPKRLINDKNVRGYNNQKYNKNKKDDNKVNDDDWEIIRKFQATEIVKKEGINAVIDNIRKHLNKISDKTYESLKKNIISDIKKIIADVDINEVDKDDKLMNELNKIGNAIFGIASSNKFYSEMYAKLYKDLMGEFNFMGIILKTNFNNFNSLFKNIEYCDSNEDYDKFCENNKTNEKRRAICYFYVNLMKYNVINKDDIMNIIIELQNDIDNLICEENQKNIVEELSELIYILVTNSVNILDKHESWNETITNITRISNMKNKSNPSISSKTIFKFMDIIDVLE